MSLSREKVVSNSTNQYFTSEEKKKQEADGKKATTYLYIIKLKISKSVAKCANKRAYIFISIFDIWNFNHSMTLLTNNIILCY